MQCIYVKTALLSAAQQLCPDLTAENAILLNIDCSMEAELALSTLLLTGLKYRHYITADRLSIIMDNF